MQLRLLELCCPLKSASTLYAHTSGMGESDTCGWAGFGDRDTSELEDDMSECRLSSEGLVSKGLRGLPLANRTCGMDHVICHDSSHSLGYKACLHD